MSDADDALKGPVNLTNCDREPIHIPGSIQPHGVLLGLDAAHVVRVASRNAALAFGAEAEALLGRPLSALLGGDSLEAVTSAVKKGDFRRINPLKLRIEPRGGAARSFDGILHEVAGLYLLELEPHAAVSPAGTGFYGMVNKAVGRVQATTATLDLAAAVAEEIRQLTGFDRVMVYRFDADWHGEVIAEAKRDDLESYFGLHYPASDIPAQARKLYERNWLRLIENVHYQPAPLVPDGHPLTGGPLDLSYSVLRSVSPVHCEYLSNMGVSASMSISLLRDGASLWGLVACHHYAPKLVPYEIRMACQFLGQTFSLLVTARERLASAERSAEIEALRGTLTERAGGTDDYVGELLRSTDVLKLTNATGVCIIEAGNVRSLGRVPSTDDVLALNRWLSTHARHPTYRVESLAEKYPEAAAFAPLASGLLAVSLGSERAHDRILWFRPEAVQEVSWAGAPAKNEKGEGGEVRLSPRGSFALWRETVRQRSTRWTAEEANAAQGLAHAINRTLVAQAQEIKLLNEELREASRAKDDFLAVVSHELRTPLNAILGWVELLRTGGVDEHEFDDAFQTIQRNALSQQQLIEDLLDMSRIISGKMRLNVEPVDPHAAVAAAIEAARPAADAKRIRLQAVLDPSAGIISGDSTRLTQIVWNLVGNALKFTPKEGRIFVRLSRRDSSVHITVSDTGQGIEPALLPHIFERFKQGESHASRTHQGLGLGLAIVKHLVELHGGTVTAESGGKDKGAAFHVSLPVAPMSAGHQEPAGARRRQAPAECPEELNGLRVLIVDDEPDSRRMIERALTRCHALVFVADSAEEGLRILAREKPELIISDIGMPGKDGYAFVAEVRALPADEGGGVPAIALTAYARGDDRTRALRAGFSSYIAKPVAHAELYAVIASVTGRNIPRPTP